MALCDIEAVLQDGACFACLPPGIAQALEIQLLCELITVINNVSAQGCCLNQGHYGGAPPTFTPITSLAMAKDQDAPFVLWWWDGTSWS